jgi:hypothetical protein
MLKRFRSKSFDAWGLKSVCTRLLSFPIPAVRFWLRESGGDIPTTMKNKCG